MKNRIQFQRGMSWLHFLSRFGTEESCRRALFLARWPAGFRCPACGGTTYCTLHSRALYQCNHCHHQTSLTANTLFGSTKVGLRVWLMAIYELTQSKDGISALNLSRRLGVSYNTAWLIKQKLVHAMLTQDLRDVLAGRVELDDAYWGGQSHGGKRGRGAPNKCPFLAAVETTSDGHPLRMKLSVFARFEASSIARWARKYLAPSTTVVSDAYGPLCGVEDAGLSHEVLVTGGGFRSMEVEALQWVNIMLGNVKNSLRGTYHGMRRKHLARYLAEFSYRFNRRFHLEFLVDALLKASAHMLPVPQWSVTMAEVAW
jgi:hypothetical protein